MARIRGKIIYTIPKWRFAVAKCAIWPISWVYALGFFPEARVDKITARLARFTCGDIRKNSRVEWE